LFHLLERPFFGAVARRDCARNALFLALERPFLARSNGSTAEDLRVFDHKFRVNFATPVSQRGRPFWLWSGCFWRGALSALR
jgi:hypothetical protein